MCDLIAVCCLPRRTACLVVGLLEVIAAVIWLIFGMYLLTGAEPDRYNPYRCRTSAWMYTIFTNCLQRRHIIAISVSIMAFGAMQLTCGSLMIHGLSMNNHYFMRYILFKKILTMFVCFAAAVAAVSFQAWIVMASAIVSIFVEVNVFVILRKYYYEVETGKADEEFTVTDNPEDPTTEVSGRPYARFDHTR